MVTIFIFNTLTMGNNDIPAFCIYVNNIKCVPSPMYSWSSIGSHFSPIVKCTRTTMKLIPDLWIRNRWAGPRLFCSHRKQGCWWLASHITQITGWTCLARYWKSSQVCSLPLLITFLIHQAFFTINAQFKVLDVKVDRIALVTITDGVSKKKNSWNLEK